MLSASRRTKRKKNIFGLAKQLCEKTLELCLLGGKEFQLKEGEEAFDALNLSALTDLIDWNLKTNTETKKNFFVFYLGLLNFVEGKKCVE